MKDNQHMGKYVYCNYVIGILLTIFVSGCKENNNTEPSVIVFSARQGSNNNIFTMNSDGSGLKRLTNIEGMNDGPVWAPDGKRIAFMLNSFDRNDAIYVMNSDGSNQQKLLENLSNIGSLCWSPDGKKFAFVSGGDRETDIYVVNSDGSGKVNITRTYPKT